ncbi:antibiotic biosynthesis monooxygenase [Paraburkholderia guartelaensis]|uniref:Antibiotic biosynthesis monooxygenase n=1 Tax=Paraburkholderia guartelaensis TaxID=2546446 RepID=A0A4R5LBV9_9BURK|nr:putative quinol monooxygenase [Paraburkholderia guartelaensis]TDG06211.1 antibiotic biosynthesis monooxygenase [Paraburkholderia guartelaensis]
MTVYLFASITPKPEHVAEVEALMRDMVAHTRKEPGNLRYDLLRRADGAPGFYLYETYVDEAAVQAHRDSAHFVAYRAKIGAWVTEPPEVKLLKGVDVAD